MRPKADYYAHIEPVGGLCARVLRDALGMSLEELILRQAPGLALPQANHREANGVMMIPIPQRGIFHGVRRFGDALGVAGISDIQITAAPGQLIAPAPERASYLGFIFALGSSPEAVESSLRAAHPRLVLEIRDDIPITEIREL